MKYILELILTTVIVFFLWNFLKRIFYSAFYKFPGRGQGTSTRPESAAKKPEPTINWDAETVDYEEVKDNPDNKN